MYQKILLCSDGSEGALRAARAAAELTKALNASLTLLHVFQLPVALASPVDTVSATVFSPPPKEVQDEVVQRAAEILHAAGVPYADRRETGFSPAEVILRVAGEEGADLIVLGSRGMGAVQRFLLGSISDRVAHHASCAVLIVR